MSNSSRPHVLQSTRLLHPWDFPSKSSGVGCHFLLQGIFPTQGLNPSLLHRKQMLYPLSKTTEKTIALTRQTFVGKVMSLLFNMLTRFGIAFLPRSSVQFSSVAQSCPALCDPMDCSPPGSTIHGILQARVLEWGAISFSRGSSQPRD